MKKLMNRAGLLVAAFALALAVALALNGGAQTPAAQAQASNPPSDMDGNGLIEITTPAQFNAMRYDLNGNGVPDVSETSESGTSESETTRACWRDTTGMTRSSCKGYELKSDISLAQYKNTWEPIDSWQAVFDGNGFSITGLEGKHGLFGEIGYGGNDAINAKTVVKNVDLVGAKITRDENQGGRTGVLAGANHATIIGSYVTGELTYGGSRTNASLGGVVGFNSESGKIFASVADVKVTVTDIPAGLRMRVGGFVGANRGEIIRSYAYGNIIDDRTTARAGSRLLAYGFGRNQVPEGGTIALSLSYGDLIATRDNSENKTPAPFALGLSKVTDSCALADESAFTCPEPEEED